MSIAVLATLIGCGNQKPAVEASPEAEALVDAPRPEPVAPSMTTLTLSTEAGELKITPVFHATLTAELGETTAVFDPWSEADLDGVVADYVFITDVHFDHLDPAAIREVSKESTVLVAPKAVAEDEKMADLEVQHVLANGESATVGPFEVTAVPMYNMERGPEEGVVFHEKGRGNGYVLRVGGKAVYIAGDTECIEEMKGLEHIDHAFLPMNLPYTMTPGEAAECVKAFVPSAVTPIHYWQTDLEAFEAALEGVEGVTIERADAYTTGAPF